MKPSVSLLKSVKIPKPAVAEVFYKAPALTSITASELPNNAFDTSSQYFIKKTGFGHWPVYKKIQNTRISTEIKRVEGDVSRFAEELQSLLGQKLTLKINKLTGEVNIKGDHVNSIKSLLDTHVKYN